MNNTSSKGIPWIIGAVVLILIIVVAILLNHTSSPTASETATTTPTIADPANLPGIQTTPAPWIAEIDHLHERLDAIGLPALSTEGSVLHLHQHIDIFVDGNTVAVPPGIGIDETAQFVSPIHVHDDTGIIHIESPTVQTFTLGQFFDIWGVRFTNECIGSYCVNMTAALKVYINGALYMGDIRQLPLAAHQEIVVMYGTAEQAPKTIPASYTFPAGE